MMIKDILLQSNFLGLLLSIASYELGCLLKRKLKIAIFNPLLISIVISLAVIIWLHIDYETYYEGAHYVNYLLTPATVCFAVPLYDEITLLKDNWKAVLLGILSGVLTSLISVFLLAVLLRLDHVHYVTLLPKSITTSIGMAISEEHGGIVSLSVAAIIITGVLGNILAVTVCRLFRIEEPIAKGVAIGCSSHAVGTTKAMEMGEVEGAMSTLSIVVAGVLTVIAASWFIELI